MLTEGKLIGTITANNNPYNIYAPKTYNWSEITSKPTTLAGFGITNAVRVSDAIDSSTMVNAAGYGYNDGGWVGGAGPAFSFGLDHGYKVLLQYPYGPANGLYFKEIYQGEGGDWRRILDTVNYATTLDNAYLKLSGGTLTGDLYFQDSFIRLDMGKTGRSRISNIYGDEEVNALAFTLTGLYLKSPHLVYVDTTGTNYDLLHEGNYENIIGNKFLKLSGGTLKLDSYSSLFFQRNGAGISAVGYSNNNGVLGYIGVAADANPIFMSASGTQNILLHAGNFNSYAPTLAGVGASGTWGIDISGSAAKATKLQTARSLWGNSFDGTADVNTHLTLNANDAALAAWKKDGSSVSLFLQVNPDRHVLIGQGTARENGGLYLYGNDIRMCYGNAGSSNNTAMLINSSGNVTIGSSDKAGENYKLYVDGVMRAGKSITSYAKDGYSQVELLYGDNVGWVLSQRGAEASKDFGIYSLVNGVDVCRFRIKEDGNVGIGTINPKAKLHVDGKLRAQLINIEGGNEINGVDNNGDAAALCLNWSSAGNVLLAYGGGNVGIGTINANAKLAVNGTANISSRLLVGGAFDDGTTALQVQGAAYIIGGDYASVGGAAVYWGIDKKYMLGSNSATDFYLWSTSTTAALRLGTNSVERIRITADGLVGIGTTTPQEALHVVGNLYVTGNIIADGQVSSGGIEINPTTISTQISQLNATVEDLQSTVKLLQDELNSLK